MECCNCCVLVLTLFILYKLFDRLLRRPKIPPLEPGARRNILITGCDTGFGNMFAKRMDRDGFHVFAACLTDGGKSALDRETSNKVKPFVMNVADLTSIRSGLLYVKSCLRQDEGLWAVVNNAGISGEVGPSEWLSQKCYVDVLDVNLFGVINVCNTFLPLLKKCRGRIVNTVSILGRIALPSVAPYCVSKFALEAYSDSLRRDISSFGVSVHIIEPGFMITNITNADRIQEVVRNTWNALPKELQTEYGGEKFLATCIAGFKKLVTSCSTSKVHLTVDAYEHAVTARFARARYMPGMNAWVLFWPLSLMPEWLSDVILAKM